MALSKDLDCFDDFGGDDIMKTLAVIVACDYLMQMVKKSMTEKEYRDNEEFIRQQIFLSWREAHWI